MGSLDKIDPHLHVLDEETILRIHISVDATHQPSAVNYTLWLPLLQVSQDALEVEQVQLTRPWGQDLMVLCLWVA